jgi:hypothetical protein
VGKVMVSVRTVPNVDECGVLTKLTFRFAIRFPTSVTSPECGARSQFDSTINKRIQECNPFFGSVAQGTATTDELPLSLRKTVTRGLRYNLGSLLSDQNARTTRGARLVALSEPKSRNEVIGKTMLDVRFYRFTHAIMSLTVPGPLQVEQMARDRLAASVPAQTLFDTAIRPRHSLVLAQVLVP